MTSIEERAYKYAEEATWDDVDGCPPDIYATNAFNAYFEGATEQKAIDEKVRLKKCDDMTEAEYNRETAFADWYHKNGKGTPTYSDAIEWARKQTIDEVCNWFKNYMAFGTGKTVNNLMALLRKALEG